MSRLFKDIKALCFDLGNTLIEFGPRQLTAQYERLKRVLEEGHGPCDEKRLAEIRKRQIVAPYKNGYVENDLVECCRELIEEIYEVEAEEDQVMALAEERYASFVEEIELAEEIIPLLERLAERYRLALLSNYPCGRSIRDGIGRLGLAPHFETVVVSGEVGYVKPHPEPFETLLGQLGEAPEQCLYIGDNWLADVQGAKRVGMGVVLTTQHVPYETFEPQDGDHEPDARIGHLAELEKLLLD